MIRRITPLALCGWALLTVSSMGGVLVVGQGGQFTQISAAVAAASTGDVILVKYGSYDRFTIDFKGIAVVAEVGQAVYVTGGIEVKNVPANRTVVLDRLFMDTAGIRDQQIGLTVSDCQGPIRVQACWIAGAHGTGYVDLFCSSNGSPSGRPGVSITNCQDVAFTQCEIIGGFGSAMYAPDCTAYAWNGGDGQPGAYVSGSLVSFYDTVIIGGWGGTAALPGGAAPGIRAMGSLIVLVDAEVTGGTGGDSIESIPGAWGAPGVLLIDSDARVLDSTIAGGAKGSGYGFPGGQLSLPIEGNGTVSDWAGSAKNFGAFKVVREGQTLVAGMTGDVGETALLFIAPKSKGLVVPQAKGVFMLDPSTLIGPVALGVVTGPAQVGLSVVVPPLPPGVQGIGVYLQGLLTGPAGATLTSWGHVALLDASL